MGAWHKIEDGLPPLGVPLMVKTHNIYDNVDELKYPVYYIKEPYIDRCEWFFLPAMEGICKVQQDYSDVEEWKEIEFREQGKL